MNLFTPPHLTKEILFSVLLPGLLFEAAFHIEFREFWRNRLAIAALAVPGVAAAVALLDGGRREGRPLMTEWLRGASLERIGR